MAAICAAKQGAGLRGVILLAAYPTKKLDDSLWAISIYGSEDGILNMEKMAEGENDMPENHGTFIIEGGNHAQFGNYGKQQGDGTAFVSAGEQQRQTVDLIFQARRDLCP